MRSDVPASVLAGACSWRPLVSAWRGTELLAESVPVVEGRLSVAGDQQVPERLTFTVPDFADGRSWVPRETSDPLARFGQFVDVSIEVMSSVSGRSWVSRLGRFYVQNWSHDDIGGSVSVEALGVLQRVADSRLLRPDSPRERSTLQSEFARLMVPGVPVVFDPEVGNRQAPRSFVYDEDRLKALYDLADAWPARIRTDPLGQVQVLPPLPDVPNPVLEFTDGERGTVIAAPRSDTRDGVFNVVKVTTSATDGADKPDEYAVAYATEGDLRPEVYGAVVREFSSPWVTTYQQAERVARSLLRESVRPATIRRVVCAPDPRVELDDAVLLVRDGERTTGWVVGFDMPLVVESSSDTMTVDVGVA